MESSAIIEGDYRYALRRLWDRALPPLVWVMLNPSTADASTNDNTIRVCIGRARLLGMGGIIVYNLFALSSTDPYAMLKHDEPIGPRNDDFLQLAASGRGSPIVCAWGDHGRHRNRANTVVTMLRERGAELRCLGFTKSGNPRHPLRVPDKQPLVPLP